MRAVWTLLWGCHREEKPLLEETGTSPAEETAETGLSTVTTAETSSDTGLPTPPTPTHTLQDVASAKREGDWPSTYFGYALSVCGDILYAGQPAPSYAGEGHPPAAFALALPTLETLGSWQGPELDYDGTGGAIDCKDIDNDGTLEIAVGRSGARDDNDYTGIVHVFHEPPSGDIPLWDASVLAFYGPAETFVGYEVAFVETELGHELWMGGVGAPISEIDGGIWSIDPTGAGALDRSDALYTLRGPWPFGANFDNTDLDGDGQTDIATLSSDGVSFFSGPWSSDRREEDRDAAWLAYVFEDDLGNAISSSGDLDGDGFEDLLLGAPHYPEPQERTGRAYLVYGGASPSGSALADTIPSQFRGELWGEGMGWAFGAGDLDGDGSGDLVIGAAAGISPYIVAGTVMVFLGPLPTAVRTARDADVLLAGEAPGDALGQSLAIADIDADGRDDILTSAIGAPNGEASGVLYLVTAASLGL